MERDGEWFYYYHPWQIPEYPTPDLDDFYDRLCEYNRHPLNLHRMSIPMHDEWDGGEKYVEEFTEVMETTHDVVLKKAMETIMETGQYAETYVQTITAKSEELITQRLNLEEPPEHLVKRMEAIIQEVLSGGEMEGVEEL
jgi:hypothetical protein